MNITRVLFVRHATPGLPSASQDAIQQADALLFEAGLAFLPPMFSQCQHKLVGQL